jgi:ABC-type sugar transport system ATPase subunit
VAIGRALVRQPQVFLFDEPLSNLDAKLRNHMRGELEKLHAELGITIVYVTHDQVEAMTLGTRIAVMEGGRLQQLGPPMEVYRRPATRFVASFIGSPEMNFLPLPAGEGGGWLRERYGDAALDPGARLGLRPEELSLTPTASPAALEAPLHWIGTVQRVERLGAEAYAEIRVDDTAVLVRTGADVQLEGGGLVRLTPEMSRLRVFDGRTGAALEARA